MKETFYLVIVFGDVEPDLRGPFSNSDDVLTAARDHREQDPQRNDGLYSLRIGPTGVPYIDTFSGGQLE